MDKKRTEWLTTRSDCCRRRCEVAIATAADLILWGWCCRIICLIPCDRCTAGLVPSSSTASTSMFSAGDKVPAAASAADDDDDDDNDDVMARWCGGGFSNCDNDLASNESETNWASLSIRDVTWLSRLPVWFADFTLGLAVKKTNAGYIRLFNTDKSIFATAYCLQVSRQTPGCYFSPDCPPVSSTSLVKNLRALHSDRKRWHSTVLCWQIAVFLRRPRGAGNDDIGHAQLPAATPTRAELAPRRSHRRHLAAPFVTTATRAGGEPHAESYRSFLYTAQQPGAWNARHVDTFVTLLS